MSQKKTVCVLFGGQSSEHEISCISATSVIKHLDKEKYEVLPLGITKKGKWFMYRGAVDKIATGEWENGPITRAIISPDGVMGGIIKLHEDDYTRARIDVVIPVLHGLYGEDGTVQGLLELAQIPYVGTGVLASALCMDKGYAKMIFKQAGIPHAPGAVVLAKDLDKMEQIVDMLEKTFEYPCFVKPCNAGSSVGITKAHHRQELENGLRFAADMDQRILVEAYIEGREIECAVLGNDNPKASVLGEIVPEREFYDYEAKYKDSNSALIIPADLDEKTTQTVQVYAVKAYKELGCSGLSRVDFFIHKQTGQIYINEINTMPGFTDISMYPKLWEESGVSYTALIDSLITLALERSQQKCV